MQVTTNQNNLCQSLSKLSLNVLNFMKNVNDVGEESITDYLLWQWSEADSRFNYNKFTKAQESSTTGADFELELWIVGHGLSLPFLVQAKKFIKLYDSYASKINYPKGTGDQLKKLLSHAKTKSRLHPVYFIYSIPDENTKTLCGSCKSNAESVFIVDAYDIESHVKIRGRNKVSRNDLLKFSIPFHCLFCGHVPSRKSQLAFSSQVLSAYPRTLPKYVSDLLRKDIEVAPLSESLAYVINPESDDLIASVNGAESQNEPETPSARAVAVYDLRDMDGFFPLIRFW